MFKEPNRCQSLLPDQVSVQVYRVRPADSLPVAGEGTTSHRYDHYRCCFVEQGCVELLIDSRPVYVREAALLVLPPGPRPPVGERHAFEGWVLLADAKLVAVAIRSVLEQAPTGASVISLTGDTQAWFQHVFTALHQAVGQQESWLVRTEVLPGLLNALLGQAAALLASQPQSLPPTGRGQQLTHEFRQLVRRHFRTHKRPADYAALLHVTGSHLNDTVKAVTGFSATYFIQQEILAEARRLLCHTGLNSQEVAYQLGYDDAKYFTRLFGKSTGLTPGQFRKRK